MLYAAKTRALSITLVFWRTGGQGPGLLPLLHFSPCSVLAHFLMLLKAPYILLLVASTLYTLSHALQSTTRQLHTCACTVPVLSYVPSLHEFSTQWQGKRPVIMPAHAASWGLHKARAALSDMLDTSSPSSWHALPVTLAASNSYSCTCTG